MFYEVINILKYALKRLKLMILYIQLSELFSEYII